MIRALAKRPRCRVCRVFPVGTNQHALCWKCLNNLRCPICSKVTRGRDTGNWCEECKEMNDICHALKTRNPGVRPDDETLAYRLALYGVRAADLAPLFDPPAWF